MTASTDATRDATVEWIARLLSAGTLASVAVVVAASLMNLAVGRAPLDARGGADVTRAWEDLAALRPQGFLWLGLLLILALPTARVVLALVGYARAGDRHGALVAAGVLGMLTLSVFVALAFRQ